MLILLNMAALLQEPTKLISLETVERHWKRSDKKNCICSVLTHHQHWVPSEMLVLNCSVAHHIYHTWPPVTSICFQNWRNSWKDWNLMTMMLSILQVAAGWRTKIKNSCTMECELWKPKNAGPSAFLLKGTMLHSDKITCIFCWWLC